VRRFDPRLVCTAAILAAAVAAPRAAQAQVEIITSLTSLPSSSAFTEVDLSNELGSTGFTLPGGAGGVAFNVATNQGVVTGAMGGLYADPITGETSGGQAIPYVGNYFSTGDGTITFSYTQNQSALALLWGSVDPGNTITLMENGSTVGVITGNQITQNPNGGQGFGGSFFVELISGLPFNEVVVSDTQPSFEFAEFESAPTSSNIPEPASLAAMGVGLLALAGLRRRRA